MCFNISVIILCSSLAPSAYAVPAALIDQVAQQPSDEATEFRYAQTAYKEGAFESLFGLTQWVRLRLWPKFNEAQRDRWVALELTALARSCRWAEIDRLFDAEGQGLAVAEEAMSLIRMKQKYRAYASDSRKKVRGVSARLEASRTAWAASPADYRRFTSPLNLKVRVESLCRF